METSWKIGVLALLYITVDLQMKSIRKKLIKYVYLG